uniref:SFRICE_017750 n=1 Tax=Spodoptera frugiperda TaxID=7108 RepID=A0A2H1X1Y8_SPOFR
MGKIICILFCLLIILSSSAAYKILAVLPIPSPSHGILGDNLVRHLLDAGHEVTYVTPFTSKQKNHTNLHIVDVDANHVIYEDGEDQLDFQQILDQKATVVDSPFLFWVLSNVADMTLSNPNVQKLMKDPQQKFDVIIVEYIFTDVFSALSAIYQCPFIWFSTIGPHWMVLNLVHGPLNPAYNTDFLQARVPPFQFLGRVEELWTQLKGLYRHKFDFYYEEERIYQNRIVPILQEQGKPVLDFNVIKYNASLLLGNSQVALGDAVPLPPNYKHIGGFHIDEEVKPLPENLQKIMDEAEHGVIYFSMGSNLKSKTMPNELKKGLLEVFGSLKQTVLWKFEENLLNRPKNVHILQWAPQQSILAHPNLVLFVTHGGLLSLTEAVHFGVPVIAIPVFSDQFLNANQAQHKGIGEQIDLSYNLDKDLKVTLDKVLDDLPKYTARAKEVSAAYRDNPIKPGQELNFWVEHVVRTRGAPHLRSVALQVPLYQQAYLDLLAVLLATAVVSSRSLQPFVVRTRGAPHLRSVALQVPLYQQAYLDLLAVLLAAAVGVLLVVRRILSLMTLKSTKLKKN